MTTSRIETDSRTISTALDSFDLEFYINALSLEAIWGSDDASSTFSDHAPYDVEAVSAVERSWGYESISDDETSDADIPIAIIEEEGWLAINPTNMSPLLAMMLTDYLMANLKAGKFYLEAEEMTEGALKLYSYYDLLWFYNSKHSDLNYFAVISHKVIGRGGNSEIRKVKGLLKPDTEGTLFYKSHKNKSKEKRWAVRFEYHTENITFQGAKSACSLMSENKKIAQKPPILIDHKNNTSASIMRCLKDIDLESVMVDIERDPIGFREQLQTYSRWDFNEIFFLLERGILQFNRIQLLQYSLAMIQAYIEQVLHPGLLHRDIKPENIIIDLQKNASTDAITFIDYEFACRISPQMNLDLLGTVGFIAPEILMHTPLNNNASGIFSLACMLAFWYGDDEPYDRLTDETDPWHLREVAHKEFSRLSPETPPEVKSILTKMVARDPFYRPSIAEVKQAYEDALEHEKFEQAICPSPMLVKK